MQRRQAEDERLEILHEVVEDAQTLRVRRFRNVDEGADLSGLRIEGKGESPRLLAVVCHTQTKMVRESIRPC